MNTNPVPDVLDLDELFGKSHPVQVSWKGKTYDLRHPDAFSPAELARFEELKSQLDNLNPNGGKMTVDGMRKFEQVLDAILLVFCESLPVQELVFKAKWAALNHYGEKVGANFGVTQAQVVSGKRKPRSTKRKK